MKLIDKISDLYDKVEDWVYEDDSTDILNVDKKNEDEVIKVIDEDNSQEAKETSNKLKKQLTFVGCAWLAAVIIIVASQGKSCNKNQIIEKASIENTVENNEVEIPEEVSEEEVIGEVITDPVDSELGNEEETNISYKEVDYTNVDTFYNHIVENRNNYGEFAESFQSEDDVKNLVNFIYQFDEMYANNETSIDSQELFDEIIRDYYKSCVNHDIQGELHLLYKEGSLGYSKLKEAEELTYELKNGTGNDYTIANNYYTWLGKNLCDKRTAITQNMKNAPLIDLLREQYEEYRLVGNMLDARKYQKNDSLDIDPIEIYYSYQFPSDADVTAMNNSFSCPDWGIDNVVSKYEETTETRLVERIDNREIYNTVTESFETVLNKGKTR